MGRVAAIGEDVRVQGFALAGVLVLPGDTPADARASWAALPADVDVVILTPSAAEALTAARAGPPRVVMPS
jgi:vacuolar-type H+-ATPase subunit F/Vma7